MKNLKAAQSPKNIETRSRLNCSLPPTAHISLMSTAERQAEAWPYPQGVNLLPPIPLTALLTSATPASWMLPEHARQFARTVSSPQ